MECNYDVNGDWEVHLRHVLGEKEVSYKVTGTLNQKEGQIQGVFVFDLDKIDHKFRDRPNDQPYQLIRIKGRCKGNLLQLNYENPDPRFPQFGYVMVEMKSETRMEGMFMGHSSENERITSGDLVLVR